MYVIFLVTFSGVVFIGNAIVNQYELENVESLYPMAESYLIVIIVIGFIYFIFLYIDIRKHVNAAKQGVQDREKRQELFEEQLAKHQAQFNGGPMELSENGNGNSNGITPIAMPVMDLPPVKPISHKYCFATGRHGEFFYLKIGATWFCFGLLIHSVLIISYQVIFMTSTDYDFQKCASIPTLIFDVLFPLYSIFVLFFIYKYANVIINEFRGLARLALMHAIGASLSFWIWTIVRETLDAINMKYYYKPDDSNADYFNKTSRIDTVNTNECPGPEALNVIYRNFSPYLYPFIIEFCILISGIFYMIYANINKCPRRLSAPGHEHTHDVTDEAETFPGSGITHDHHNAPKTEEEAMSEFSEHCRNTTEHENQYKSNLVIHADCHAANRGLFAGLVLMILTIVFIILFFVAVSEP